MAAIPYSASDYLTALQNLLPRGKVWPKEPDTVQSLVLSGFSQSLARLDSRATYLITDAFPTTTYELLPDWENSLGLPDPCAGTAPSIAARRAQVVAKFIGNGGQSSAWIISYATALGYTITITNYAPARVGASHIGDPLNDSSWAHAWAVNAPLNSVTYATIGTSGVGDPLANWGNTVLECEIKSIAPAQTKVLFIYS